MFQLQESQCLILSVLRCGKIVQANKNDANKICQEIENKWGQWAPRFICRKTVKIPSVAAMVVCFELKNCSLNWNLLNMEPIFKAFFPSRKRSTVRIWGRVTLPPPFHCLLVSLRLLKSLSWQTPNPSLPLLAAAQTADWLALLKGDEESEDCDGAAASVSPSVWEFCSTQLLASMIWWIIQQIGLIFPLTLKLCELPPWQSWPARLHARFGPLTINKCHVRAQSAGFLSCHYKNALYKWV